MGPNSTIEDFLLAIQNQVKKETAEKEKNQVNSEDTNK